jgi:beta-glucosidase-like glycosyl hydrolase
MPQLKTGAALAMTASLLALSPQAADAACAGVRALDLGGMPAPIALAASWDPALVARVYGAVAADAHAHGARMVLGPSLAIARDPRRGYPEETFGEDPYLAGELGVAAIEALRKNGVTAAATGFAGPALPRDSAGAAPMSERELRSVYLAPFARAIERAHLDALVPSRNALDGVPSHANRWLLKDVLRGELAFRGQVIADPQGVHDLVSPYGVARDDVDAMRIARDAGIDVLDCGAQPGTDAPRVTAAWKSLASQAAQDGVILLANDGALPLPSRAKLALLEAGAPGAFGEALRKRGRHVEWVDPWRADRILVVMGEAPADGQRNAIEDAARRGKPMIVVLAGERPWIDAGIAAHANALVAAWGLGLTGPDTAASVLFGDAEPGGRLPVTLARGAGDLPLFHDAKPSAHNIAYLFDDGRPLFPFGFGLAYTTFETGAPRLARDSVAIDEAIEVSVHVRNTGTRRGTQVVQVYVRDLVSSVTTPTQRLAAFAKASLAPGEARELRLTVEPRSLALWNASMRHVVEPGDFEILAGPDAAHLEAAIVHVRAKGS